MRTLVLAGILSSLSGAPAGAAEFARELSGARAVLESFRLDSAAFGRRLAAGPLVDGAAPFNLECRSTEDVVLTPASYQPGYVKTDPATGESSWVPGKDIPAVMAWQIVMADRANKDAVVWKRQGPPDELTDGWVEAFSECKAARSVLQSLGQYQRDVPAPHPELQCLQEDKRVALAVMKAPGAPIVFWEAKLKCAADAPAQAKKCADLVAAAALLGVK